MVKTFRYPIVFLVVVGLFCSFLGVGSGTYVAVAQEDEQEEEEIIPTGIPPLSKRTAVLSIPLAVYPFNEEGKITFRDQNLVEITVQFEDRTEGREGLDLSEDFLPLSSSAETSGIALYRESGANPKEFNFATGDPNSDAPIDLSEKPIVEEDPTVPGKYTVTFRPTQGNPHTQLNLFNDERPDFYIVVRTSLDLLHGDRFEVSVPANGIKIKDKFQELPKDTLYEDRFPGEEFADLNPDFAEPALFEGDIVRLTSVVSDQDNTNRIGNSSEPRTIFGLDFVGREDQEYFLEEIRVNWVGVNLGAIAKLITHLSKPEYSGATTAGMDAVEQQGMIQQSSFYNPSFFYSPLFYNFPTDPETGELLTETRAIGEEEEIEYPMTMPLDNFGMPIPAFQIGMDTQNHKTGYVTYGPRLGEGINSTFPRVVSQNILQAFRANAPGGVFLYRERGGTDGKYDPGQDNLIKLDLDKFRFETFDIDPEEVQTEGSPIRGVIQRLLPGVVGGDSAKNALPFLFGDDNLATALMGVAELPEPAEEPRPPMGSLECYMDPDCLFFDLMINVLRPYLGLTEGQIRYLFEYTEDNGRSNAEELFGYQLIQGFSFVLPVSQDNALSDLMAPTSREGDDAGADIYLGIRTSDELRNLDSFIPFIRPQDLKIGTNVSGFAKGATEGVESLKSVSSIGYGRKNTNTSYAMIGRPRPRVQYMDLTQPGEGPFASNDNILYDDSLGSPPKAVIGVDITDFGQNASLTTNAETIEQNLMDMFLTENTVLGEMQIDFLPGPRNLEFNPAIIGVIPIELGINTLFNRRVSSHDLALYYDDDTPTGDGIDNDGDGLIDEERYNLMDDDGDGLIDEDLGDGSPAGTNGVFDANDQPFPSNRDSLFGGSTTVEAAHYVFPPNSSEKYQDYIEAIQEEQAVDEEIEIEDGGLMPLNLSEGSWFAELDMRVLGNSEYEIPRSVFFPPSGFRPFGTTAGPPYDPPEYNQGTMISPSGFGFGWLEPYTGLLDLLTAMRGILPDFPYYPDDLYIEDPESGEQTWILVYAPDGDDALPAVADPEGDERRSFALTMASGFRLANPNRGFARSGSVPLVINVPGDNAEDPQGDNIDLVTQFGYMLGIDADVGDYLSSAAETLQEAYDEAYEAIEEYEEEIQGAEDDAADAEEPTDPEYPDPPEVVEVSVDSPYDSLVGDFIDDNDGIYETNIMYSVQLPDENFGPLAGNDYFVVLRASEDAQVGDSFKVRIRSGERNRTYESFNPDENEFTTVDAPQGGVGYHSFIEPNYQVSGGEPYRNVSKSQITTSEIVVRSSNEPPSIQFINPGPGLNLASSDYEFEITFTAEDSDDVARIQLFVDTDSLDFDGQFIPGSTLREGFDNSFTLKMDEHIKDFDPSKKYYIYARISDGVNPEIYTYADGYITTPAAIDPREGDGDGGGQGIVVRGDMENTVDYIKMTRDGRTFSLGQAPVFDEPNVTGDVVDTEVNATFSGQILVQRDGRVIGNGDIGSLLPYLQPNGDLDFPSDEVHFYKNSVDGGELISSATEGEITIDRARDVEVDFDRGAVYVLDGDGDMLFLGDANTDLVPRGMDMDWYRDMELSPDGEQMYFLTGNGMFEAAGGSAVGEWTNLVEEDRYRDIELVTKGGQVTAVVIADDSGDFFVLGDSSVKSSLEALVPQDPIEPGTIRQVKLLPGKTDTLLLVEGGGKIHFLTSDEELRIPEDGFEFSDDPGMDDDLVVDVETTDINLQSVVEAVRTLLEAYEDENIQTIMGFVDPDYKDRNGADAQGFNKSLQTFFSFYEVNTFSESRMVEELLNEDSFVITNQGDTIQATVYVDFQAFYPQVEFIVPETDENQTTQFDAGVLVSAMVDQTVRLREVSDGRFWAVTLYTVRNYGIREEEMLGSEDFEFEDIDYIKKMGGTKRVGIYSPAKKGVDPPMHIRLDVDETDPFAYLDLVGVFQKRTYARHIAPPAFEVVTYIGDSLSATPFDAITFSFQASEDGGHQLISARTRQIMQENSELGDPSEDVDVDPALSTIDGTEVDDPFGFSFKDRGVVVATQPLDSDLIVSGDQFIAPSLKGGIMMLPENTDIFTLDPEAVVERYNRSTMLQNPYDPNEQDDAGADQSEYTSSLIAGRAYLVVARDGKHYGFVQIPSDADVEDESILFDYRYEDSFELPRGF